ncbi:MAG: ROK family protein [Propionicimonas sp.]|uniref:polyphosphate--glucose phosphotransferase n=1 Tax=Propionicimonas sp. TaxID=1955623 RepID=UPI002B2206CE|nr:ROK family protein [Propionicimonas sp.]MEA4944653.1 ROK family protein [Propionicimonas sp.]MEA5051890.1 ROK family protein [Propionicimonas sp.]MEA5118287.1 ROK family protein [Propionicimonas sp.]
MSPDLLETRLTDRQSSIAGRARGIAFGIDIGGTGIKGAPVDLATGLFCEPRRTVATPSPATPQAVARAAAELRAGFDGLASVPVGVTVPAVVRKRIVRTAANIDPSWIGIDGQSLFDEAFGTPVALLNDADAAGLAEVTRGAAQGEPGVVFVVTLGTGIGSALFVDGRLVPNTELGHLRIDGFDCCPWASAAALTRDNLSWADWVSRVQEYLAFAESLIWPDLIVIGGGISAEAERFLPLLQLDAPVVRARMGNDSGIIGAAYEAHAAALR